MNIWSYSGRAGFHKIKTALMVMVLAAAMTGCGREPLLYVDGQAVSEEEMNLLDHDMKQAVRAVSIQKWAEESGFIRDFSYENLMKEMEEENKRRAVESDQGGIVYGMARYTPMQYYKRAMGEYERLLKDQLARQADETTLLDYYKHHQEEYWQIGTIDAKLTVRAGGKVMKEADIHLDQYNYRSFQEADDALASMLVTMQNGDSRVWEDEYGQELTLVCSGSSVDKLVPYEEISGAVLYQYAGELFEYELKQRIADSTVQDLR